MILLVERVRAAEVFAAGDLLGRIGTGLLVQVGFARGDRHIPGIVRLAARRLLALRLFPDARGRLSRDVAAADAEILLVPAFVLAARASGSGRLDLATVEPAELARPLFEDLVKELRTLWPDRVEAGRFGAAMTLRVEHDGPVPYLLRLERTQADPGCE